MTDRTLTNDPPVQTDPLLVDGVKYRIVSIDKGLVQARESYGAPRLEVTVPLDDLSWDKTADVWRAP